jgi:hypothetical protein
MIQNLALHHIWHFKKKPELLQKIHTIVTCK